MNERALRQNSIDPSSRSQSRRLMHTGHLVWGLSLVGIVFCGSAIAWYLYADSFSKQVDPETVRSVVIGEASSPAMADAAVPADSITAGISQEVIDAAEHPLDPLLEIARNAVNVMDENVNDYSATIIKRVRWQERLQDEQFVFCKIRHACTDPVTGEAIPFGCYTRFLKPKAGQEAIWVDGRNDDKLIAHGPPGLLNVLTFHLETDSNLAMNGNRYSIRCIGMLYLLKQMIEKGERDRNHGNCEVRITRNIPVGLARCTRLEIIHPKKAPQFDFYKAEIYIDDQRNLPIAYVGYHWPDKPGGSPKLIERYLYTDIKVNVGLTDLDFDPANEDYKYPGN